MAASVSGAPVYKEKISSRLSGSVRKALNDFEEDASYASRPISSRATKLSQLIINPGPSRGTPTAQPTPRSIYSSSRGTARIYDVEGTPILKEQSITSTPASRLDGTPTSYNPFAFSEPATTGTPVRDTPVVFTTAQSTPSSSRNKLRPESSQYDNQSGRSESRGSGATNIEEDAVRIERVGVSRIVSGGVSVRQAEFEQSFAAGSLFSDYNLSELMSKVN